ncbi:hypothetical protein FHR99_001398 [Litorivivens lipolytica]|uniref:Lipid A 3-O-deacylase n=1 Tax=Litorivivens lipolytica TaxID=1524264 RepID=A0A7W4Z5I4_9GAMM|nr:acyloxyacyl hydrolase [Litorivivens lipolytica]MBB3047162.1 hypothetical protein [Litorivivens lipolytica]
MGNKKVALLGAALITLSHTASAFEMPSKEAYFGVLAHNKGPIASETEDGPDINLAYHLLLTDWQWGDTPWGLYGHGGAVINLSNGTSYVYAGLNTLAQIGQSDWFYTIGAGIAVHDGDLEKESPDRRELGNRTLFRLETSLGYQFNPDLSLSFVFDHISHGSILHDDNNRGLDTYGLRLGWLF